MLTAISRDASFSKCRRYRYVLRRNWNRQKPIVAFIGLNPSSANETSDDPTSRRCMGFANDWGYGGISLINLFAFCAHSPKSMMMAADPIGSENDRWIDRVISESDLVIAAWGNRGTFMDRANELHSRIDNMYCLKLTERGQPMHPLYVKADIIPIAYIL